MGRLHRGWNSMVGGGGGGKAIRGDGTDRASCVFLVSMIGSIIYLYGHVYL